MKFIYPAIIRKNSEGMLEATFPDLTGCTAVGTDIDDVCEKANEAACDWIYLELTEDGHGMLPPITDVADMDLQEGDIVRNICANVRFTDGYDE